MEDLKLSVIIPVYNRPQELDELLESISRQSQLPHEIIVVEDGSSLRAEEVALRWKEQLPVRYFFKENTGQGFSRNFGFSKATGNYLLVFDSDCLLPPHYFQALEIALSKHRYDAFGGPDRAHSSFTRLQKAISYSMTSPFTTGGIRGGKRRVGQFHPRSFNMGISREVWKHTGGYVITRMGEDIEFSLRIISQGFKTGLIPEAYVYHKRRTSLKQFYRQLHFFGRARINIARFFPKELKLVHWFPAVFLLGTLALLIGSLLNSTVMIIGGTLYSLYFLLIFLHSFSLNKSLRVALLSLLSSFVQLWAYGHGFLQELLSRGLRPYLPGK